MVSPLMFIYSSTAVNLNVGGVQRMLDLAHTMKGLDCFMHVSTAYSQTDQKVIEERIYPSPMEPSSLLELVKFVDVLFILILV